MFKPSASIDIILPHSVPRYRNVFTGLLGRRAQCVEMNPGCGCRPRTIFNSSLQHFHTYLCPKSLLLLNNKPLNHTKFILRAKKSSRNHISTFISINICYNRAYIFNSAIKKENVNFLLLLCKQWSLGIYKT